MHFPNGLSDAASSVLQLMPQDQCNVKDGGGKQVAKTLTVETLSNLLKTGFEVSVPRRNTGHGSWVTCVPDFMTVQEIGGYLRSRRM